MSDGSGDAGADVDDADGDPDAGAATDPGAGADWPVPLAGVTESVVATLGPNDRWNLAALGLHEPERDVGSDTVGSGPTPGGGVPTSAGHAAPARARTWGRTRTRRNFAARGGGVVQFVADPRDFVDAAVTVREEADPVVDSADAWVRVSVERVDAGERGGTEWVDWRLTPAESAVVGGGVRTINRGFGAVIEATVAASRLDVPAYDTDDLLDRLAYFERVVDRCGGAREREAFARLSAETRWRERDERRE